jgi:hypothetical protein
VLVLSLFTSHQSNDPTPEKESKMGGNAETNRMRAIGHHKVELTREKRNVDVAAALLKVTAISTARASAVTNIGLNTAPGDTAALANLTTIATRVTELTAILNGAIVDDDTFGANSGISIGPIITQLNLAKTKIALATSQGDTDANTALDAADALVAALDHEDVTAIRASIASAKTNVALNTSPGDVAAGTDIDTAIAAVEALF